MTVTLDLVILHTVVHHSSTSTYMPNFIEIEKNFFCGRKDACMDRWTFDTHLIRSTHIVDLKTGHVTQTTPIRGQSVISSLALDKFYLHTKFGESRFSRTRDMIVASKLKMDHVTLTMPLLGVVCHPKARIWYSLPVCKIWRF